MGHANVCMEVAAIANLVLDRDRNAVTNIPTEPRAGRRIRPLIKVCCLQQAAYPVEARNSHRGSITISRIYTGGLTPFLYKLGNSEMSACRLIFKCWRISIEV